MSEFYILSEQGVHYVGSCVLEGLQEVTVELQEQPEQAY
jgi:hypothetical protein